jgi:hypothetical protein
MGVVSRIIKKQPNFIKRIYYNLFSHIRREFKSIKKKYRNIK